MDLFGHPRSRYEPELTILANKRIEDGRALLKKFAWTRKHKFSSMSYEEREAMLKAYQDTDKAIRWWEKILREE